jgi:hypothetical protein
MRMRIQVAKMMQIHADPDPQHCVAEKSERLPVLTYLLLQNGPDMGVGGIGGQSEHRPGQGVRQGNHGDEGLFGSGEGFFHLRRPGESFGVTCEGGGERTERPSGPGEERR